MRNTRGYIAIVSAIIISLALSLQVFVNSTTTLWTRFEQLHGKDRTTNENLSRSCAYEALLQYTEDPNSITPNEKVLINPGFYCVIDSVTTTSSSQSFAVHTHLSNTFAGMVVDTNKDMQTGILTITSWRDITSIPP
jgi:hypothetical protein